MKPSLDITSPVGQRLASNALFERIQKAFNLYPSKILVDVKKRAQEENCDARGLFAEVIYKVMQQVLPKTLHGLVVSVGGREKVTLAPYLARTKEIAGYFNLPTDTQDLADMAERFKETAAREGFDAVAGAQEFNKYAPVVFNWAFAEVLRILVKEGRS